VYGPEHWGRSESWQNVALPEVYREHNAVILRIKLSQSMGHDHALIMDQIVVERRAANTRSTVRSISKGNYSNPKQRSFGCPE